MLDDVPGLGDPAILRPVEVPHASLQPSLQPSSQLDKEKAPYWME